MAQKDNNDKNNNYFNENEKEKNSPEKGESSEYKKAREEAINEARNLEAELAEKLEESELQRDKKDAPDFLKEMDFRNEDKESKERPERAKELSDMFEEIPTDHIEYPLLRKLLPNFISWAERQRLGKNIPVDAVILTAGATESALSVGMLAGHAVADAGKLVFQPKKEYENTKDFV